MTKFTEGLTNITIEQVEKIIGRVKHDFCASTINPDLMAATLNKDKTFSQKQKNEAIVLYNRLTSLGTEMFFTNYPDVDLGQALLS